MECICPFEDDQDFSSGCESGWTVYLGHDEQEHDFFFGAGRNRVYEEEGGEEDEDLSMVSDASSGPPHWNEEDSYGSTGKDSNGGCFYRYGSDVTESALSGKNPKKQKTEVNPRRTKDNGDQHSSSNLLDDTASSPFFGFSSERFTHTRISGQASMENELDFSQADYSTTHFEGRPHNYHETCDFSHSSVSGNHLYPNQWFEGKQHW